MESTRLSSKGQVIIPKALLNAHHWRVGQELIAINTGDGILLKPKKPSLRWVFQCFQAVHIVIVNCQKQVSNLTDARWWILRFLGNACQKYYLLC